MIFAFLISTVFAEHAFRGMSENAVGVSGSFDISGDKNNLVITSILAAAPANDSYSIGYGDTTVAGKTVLMADDDYEQNSDNDYEAKKSFDLYEALSAAKHSHAIGCTYAAGDPPTNTVVVNGEIVYKTSPTVTIAKNDTDATKAKITFAFADDLGAGPISLRNKVDNAYVKTVLTKVTAANAAGSYYTSVDKAQFFAAANPVLGFIADEAAATMTATELVSSALPAAPEVALSITKNGKLTVGADLAAADDQKLFCKVADKTISAFTATATDKTPVLEIDGTGAAIDLLVSNGKDLIPATLSESLKLVVAPTVTYAFAKTADDDNTPKIVATATAGVAKDEIVTLKAPTTAKATATAAETGAKVTFDLPLAKVVRSVKDDNLYLFKETAGVMKTSPIIVKASTITFKNGAATDTDMVYDFQITAGSLPHAPGTLLVYPDGATPVWTKSHIIPLVWSETLGKATASYKYDDLDADTTFKAVVIPSTLVKPVAMPTELVTDSIAAPKEKPAPAPEASFSVVASFVLALTSIAVLLL